MANLAGAKHGDVLCFGHTHVPWTRTVEGVRFVNTGSVGRPKDGDSLAGYALLSIHGSRVESEMIRVEYDVSRAIDAIRASDLPNEFADYLAAGGRPTVATPDTA